MGFYRLSTANADYTVHLSSHLEKMTVKGLDNADCAIFETGIIHPDLISPDKLLADRQYREVAQKIIGERKPVFLTDLPPRKDFPNFLYYVTASALVVTVPLSLSFLLDGVPGAVATGVAYYHAAANVSGFAFERNRDHSKNKILTGLSYLMETSEFYLPGILRDAVTARKAEEFVAPEMAERLGRKPNIALFFGSNHHGIRISLKHKKVRDAIIALHAKSGYVGVDRDYLDPVHEFDFQDGEQKPMLTRWETSLFEK